MQENISATAAQWFYEEKGQRKGGIDEPTMIALIKSGKLGHRSSVWKQGFADWMNLEDTPLSTHLDQSSPPPLAGQHVNNTMVWVLAVAPILGLFLEICVAMLVYDNEDRALGAAVNNQFFYISVALNILLSVLDIKRLQKAGHNTSAFKGWVWLVPVYLYQRAKHLKQNLSYFAVWIACFVLVLLGSAT